MDAVLADDVVTINLSQTEAEIQVAANRFMEKSTNSVMTRCVGRVNSILIRVRQQTGVDNPRACYSGHYYVRWV